MINIQYVKERKSFKYYSYIENKLTERYTKVGVDGNEYFYNEKDNCYFKITVLPRSINAFVIEYADGLVEAKNGGSEDGDLFYVDDMTKEQMLEEMIQEIEG